MAGTGDAALIRELRCRLQSLTLADAHALGRRLERLTRARAAGSPGLAGFTEAVVPPARRGRGAPEPGARAGAVEAGGRSTGWGPAPGGGAPARRPAVPAPAYAA